ncbi:heat shock protein GrpE [Candidatus Pelagibacter sp. IMCC9063]|uniref:nucleotide exchange factor GrpE n=1 Tax=Pelagibacter sp. (strain IMCC9063) TaxID=1002672 RepID=UPI0002046743|nr:nucleotide exchange factor GrpE [Candidatus Pelagibacter sp. IMCC9063]AEA80841.1 heat shock protein GrpE [Candidatus Pelagibacter sp. IMCC9063]
MNTEEKKENLESLQEEDNTVETNSTPEEESNLEENGGETKEDLADSQEKKIAELNDKVLRLLAENQNVRKNQEKEKEDILKYGSFNFASQILNLTDNLDRAFSIFKNNEKFKDKEFIEITNGIELIEKELLSTLEKNSITYIDCLNKKFDPNFHQALSEIDSEKEPGTVVEEVQKGYMLHDRLLRPSLVNVAKSSKKEEKK